MYGLMNNAAIDDLRALIGCNYEEFTRAYVAKPAGMLIGSMLAGPTSDAFPAKIDLILMVSMFVMSGSLLVLPLCPSLILMGGSFLLQGVGQAALSASGNAHVMSMWGQENSSPVLSLHCGYAIGNVLGPILVGPFLVEQTNQTTDTDSVLGTLTQYAALHEPATVEFRNATSNGHLWIPYAAGGGMGILVAIIFLLFFCMGLPQELQHTNNMSTSNERKNLKSLLSPGSCTGGNTIFGLQMFFLIFIYYVTSVGKDSALMTFTLPIAISKDLPLDFSKKSADLLITIVAICAAVGRILAALSAKCISINVLVFAQTFFVMIALVMLVVWGLEYVVVYWVGNCLFSLFNSPLFPSVLAWADQYVQMTAVAVAVVDIATGIGALLFAWLAGYVFQYNSNGAAWVLYLSLGCGVAMTITMVAMQILGSCKGNRHINTSTSEEEEPIIDA